MKITDRMVAGATGYSPDWLVGRTIVAVHEIADSEREETLLLLDDGRSCVISCDPVTHDDAGVRLPAEEWGERWEVVLYDATDTPAGQAARDAARDAA